MIGRFALELKGVPSPDALPHECRRLRVALLLAVRNRPECAALQSRARKDGINLATSGLDRTLTGAAL